MPNPRKGFSGGKERAVGKNGWHPILCSKTLNGIARRRLAKNFFYDFAAGQRVLGNDPAYFTAGRAERVIGELIPRHPFENSAAG